MQTSSCCKSRDVVGLELEDLMSDLHALKALYGLLHKGSKIPSGNSNSHDSMDEKSKKMLKKLLDDATQQALQCQAKIVSCTLEPEKPRAEQAKAKQTSCHRTEGIERGIRSDADHSVLHHGQVTESQSPLAPSKEQESGDLERQKSEKLDRMTKEGEGSSNRHRRIHRGAARDRSSEVNNTGTTLGAETTGESRTVQARREAAVPRLKAAVPLSQTRTRVVEAAEPPTNRTRLAEGQSANRKPTGSSNECGACSRTKSAVSRGNRTGSTLVDGRTKRTALPDRTTTDNVGIKNKISTDGEGPTVVMPRSKEQGHRSLPKHSGRRFIKPEKPSRHHKDPSLGMPPRQLSRVGRNNELSRRAVRNERQTPRQTKDRPVDQVGPKRTTTPNRMRSIRYSSPSHTTGTDTTPSRRTSSSITRSDSGRKRGGALRRRAPVALSPPMARRISSHRALVPMRAARARVTSPLNRAPIHGRRIPREKNPRRMLSHHGEVGPPHANAKLGRQKKREGRLRRFKDKLAIIFHHHHHHHHHLHAGHVGGDDDGGVHLKHHHHRSPWEYLRRILHRTGRSKEDHGKLVTGRRAPTQHQNGYLHALLEGLLRHVWGTKERRAAKARRRRMEKAASRVGVGPKKLHWWQRIGKGRGVKLANRKKPRIKLGFARENRRATKKLLF